MLQPLSMALSIMSNSYLRSKYRFHIQALPAIDYFALLNCKMKKNTLVINLKMDENMPIVYSNNASQDCRD
jgi:hypothetical protein